MKTSIVVTKHETFFLLFPLIIITTFNNCADLDKFIDEEKKDESGDRKRFVAS